MESGTTTTPLPAAGAEPRLGRYVLSRVLGSGAQGRVLLAHDSEQAMAPCAIKVVAGPLALRLQTEYALLRGISHPCLARVVELLRVEQPVPRFGLAPPALGLVSELVPGAALDRVAARLSPDARLSLALYVLDRVARALCAIHAQGLVHGDVKPGNILVSDDLAGVKLIDLGLARPPGDQAELSGTFGFIAPEVFRGELQPAADLYALGMTVWRVLTGGSVEPAPGQLAEQLARALRPPGSFDPLPGSVPAAFARLLAELTAASPADRPVSARALVQRVSELASIAPPSLAKLLGAAADAAQTAVERSLAVTSLPLVGHGAAVDALAARLSAPGLLAVVGPPGAGRSRVLREAVARVQRASVDAGRDVAAYLRVRELPAQVGEGAWLVHLEAATTHDVASARALLRAAEITGAWLAVVLELSDAPEGVASVPLGALRDVELEKLLSLALPELPVKAPLVREAQAATGGLSGRLCRLLSQAFAREQDVTRKGALRAAAAAASFEGALPDSLGELAELLAVSGGTLSRAAALAGLCADGVALARQAHDLLRLGACTETAHGALELRPDLVARLRCAVAPARAEALAARVPEALLDARARAFLLAARGRRELALSSFCGVAQALLRQGAPAAAAQVAREASSLLGDDESLALLHAEALRALGEYAEALRVADAADTPRGRLLRAELLRLSGDSAGAQSSCAVLLAEPAAAESHAAARVLLARLCFDRGELDRAAEELRLARTDCDPAVALRASEVVGLCELSAGRLAQARAELEAALPAALRLGERAAEARLLSVLACVTRAQGLLPASARTFARACELADAAGERHAAASFFANLGTAELDAGELGPALATFREAARRLARLGRDSDLARALHNLAFASLLCGDLDVAEATAVSARRAASSAHDAAALAFALVVAAEVAVQRGEEQAAQGALQELGELGALSRAQLTGVCARAASVAVALRQLDAAEGFLARGAASAVPADTDSGIELALARAALAEARGDLRAAREQAELALAAAKSRAGHALVLLALVAATRTAHAASDAPLARARASELRSVLDAVARTLSPAQRARFREVPAYRLALAAAPMPAAAAPEHDPRFRALSAIGKRLTAEHRLSRIFEVVLDAAIELSGADRGCLLWLDKEGEPVVRARRGALSDGAALAALSRSIVARVLASQKPLVTVDAAADARLDGAASVHALALRSVVAVPIRAQGELLGALYLEDRVRPFAFGEIESNLLADLADFAAIAMLSAERLRRERRATRRLEIARARLTRQLQAQAAELHTMKELARRAETNPSIVAHSAVMQAALKLALRVAKTAVPVLLRGESGTGKELFAKLIHDESPRAKQRFISENCGAIPETLLESALFGHERGAFTGADRRRPGLFEIADGGTLFLDEIGEMTPPMQARLLRVLQDGEVRPLGGDRTLHVDVRVLSATHRDLEAMVKQGTFREDLYYRLAVVSVAIAPLRERPDDIAPLVAALVHKHALRKVRIDRRALARLVEQPWPGNVRELENVLRRALALCDDVIREEHLGLPAASGAGAARSLDLRAQIDDLERRLIRRALESAEGNQTHAAELLGISRFGLQKMRKRLGEAR